MEDKAKILIVDDELSALYTLEMLLSPEPYDVILANTPEEGMLRLENEPPDVILLDVMMPNTTGYDICQQLKGDGRWRHIPVILVTALDGKEDLVRGLNSGADEFITKPVNGPELRARVHSMLRIKQQYDEIQDALQLREELANMIVHDMRTPLSTIMLYIDLLVRLYNPSDKQQDILPKIQSQARRLNTMLTDMLLLAKMQAGKLVLDRAPLDLGGLVQSSIKEQEVTAEAKRIQVAVEMPDELPEVSLDNKLMQRTMENLLSNALKFSPEDSTVTVRLDVPRNGPAPNGHQPSLCIQIIDEGPGVPEDFRETIFDRFEVVKMKSADVTQVGIGLAFCKMVVEAHEGTIWVDDNLPQGAVFTLEL